MAPVKPDRYVALAEGVAYRGLETPHLFHRKRDELYRLDESGLAFLEEIDAGTRGRDVVNRRIYEYAAGEGLLAAGDAPPPPIRRGVSPVPSLRYLELMLTFRCNLRCRHCYLGEPRTLDMAPELFGRMAAEFDAMQGLRLLLSGGEPLLHPGWDRLAPALAGRGFRVVLLSNGLLLDEKRLRSLPIQEVQLSLDGLEKGHDALRGAGSFSRAKRAARLVGEAGLDLSVATMIHAGNMGELDGLEALVHYLGAREWNLEVPTAAGRWLAEAGLALSPEAAAQHLGHAFGASYHGSASGHACGYHLASLLPGGELCACGFYQDAPLGNAGTEGLPAVWGRKQVGLVEDIPGCRECEDNESCGGGCRFRAGGNRPDPVMCAAYGR
jgi:radical SAM protein with 4Fe4S-binding SPASM domain